MLANTLGSAEFSGKSFEPTQPVYVNIKAEPFKLQLNNIDAESIARTKSTKCSSVSNGEVDYSSGLSDFEDDN